MIHAIAAAPHQSFNFAFLIALSIIAVRVGSNRVTGSTTNEDVMMQSFVATVFVISSSTAVSPAANQSGLAQELDEAKALYQSANFIRAMQALGAVVRVLDGPRSLLYETGGIASFQLPTCLQPHPRLTEASPDVTRRHSILGRQQLRILG